MGFYAQTPGNHHKATWLAMNIDGARLATFNEARHVASQLSEGGEEGVFVVLNNGPFEAAGYAYSLREFEEFTDTVHDPRPRKYVIMPRKTAERISGYARVNRKLFE